MIPNCKKEVDLNIDTVYWNGDKTDLAFFQSIVDAHNMGKSILIVTKNIGKQPTVIPFYENEKLVSNKYILTSVVDNTRVMSLNNVGYNQLQLVHSCLDITLENNTVSKVDYNVTAQKSFDYLDATSPNKNNIYIPALDNHPATKNYVDNTIKECINNSVPPFKELKCEKTLGKEWDMEVSNTSITIKNILDSDPELAITFLDSYEPGELCIEYSVLNSTESDEETDVVGYIMRPDSSTDNENVITIRNTSKGKYIHQGTINAGDEFRLSLYSVFNMIEGISSLTLKLEGNVKFLPVNRNIEFTPTYDYHPATKKYVDDKTAYKNYSTGETLTGDIWIDGNPVYRKVIQINRDIKNLSTFAHNISNYIDIIDVKGYAKVASDAFVPINSCLTNGNKQYNSCVCVEGSNVIFYLSTDREKFISANVIIDYTKAL